MGHAIDLTEMIRCDLENRDAVFGAELAQRDGQPVESVVVGPVLEDGVLRGQHRRDGLLGRGLAHAAGDADDLYLLFCQDEACPSLDGLPGIRDHDAGGAYIHGVLAENAGRTAGAGVADVVMAIGALGLDRQEELPGRTTRESKQNDSNVTAPIGPWTEPPVAARRSLRVIIWWSFQFTADCFRPR